MEKRDLNVFGLGRITVTYTADEHRPGDNAVTVYGDYKISIHLSNGLYGVINDRLVGGERGDVSLYAPEELHFGRFTVAGRFRFINILLSADCVRSLEAEHPPLSRLFCTHGDRQNSIRAEAADKARIIESAETLALFAEHRGTCSELEAFSLILQLLLLCATLYGQPSCLQTAPIASPFVQRTVEYIARHYADRLTLDSLARIAGCSTVYLSKCFKQYMGSTVHQYLTEYRIGKATALLRAGCSVTDACYRVGFSDCSGFIRLFKKKRAVTPYQYKQNATALTEE